MTDPAEDPPAPAAADPSHPPVARPLGLGLFIVSAAALGMFLARPEKGLAFLTAPRSLVILAILFGVVSITAFLIDRQRAASPGAAGAASDGPSATPSPWQIVGVGGVSFLVFSVIAWAIADAGNIDLAAQLAFSPGAIGAGLLATVPLAALLAGLMLAPSGPIARFREQQIRHFAERGFVLSWAQIVLISLGAGVTEELLFRGALQAWLTEFAGLGVGLLIPSLLFGLVHGASAGYMLVTGAMGLYFAVLTVATGSLWPAIVAHTLYDVIALRVTVRAIRARTRDPAGGTS